MSAESSRRFDGISTNNYSFDYFIFIAQKREISPLFKTLQPINNHFYSGVIHGYNVGVYVTGVGKNAVKLSVKRFRQLNIMATTYLNLGNVGALKDYLPTTIFKVGQVFGENGKKCIVLDNNSPFSMVTVNSTQRKGQLRSQYPEADLVDMELYEIAKLLQGLPIVSYKIVIDSYHLNPNSWLFKIILPLLIWVNAKKLSTYISEGIKLQKI